MNQFEELRQVAEHILAGKNTPAAFSLKEHADISKVLHELSVYQIELELQNEELRAAKLRSEKIQQHLAQLYHQAPVGYASLNSYGMIIEANHTFAQLLVMPLEELLGKSITHFMPDADKNAFMLRYQGFYQHPDGKTIETCLLTNRKRPIQVRLDGRRAKHTLITEQEQEKEILLVSVADISEIKRIQQALIAAKEEAEQANQAKSVFLSQMSHNLRTPLNAILGFAQILELYQPIPLDIEQSEYIQHIMEAGQHLLDLINDVLNLAKIEAGQIDITHSNVNLHTVLQQLIALVKPVAAQRNITLNYQQEDVGLVLATDAVRLKEVLLNLLSNAIKYNRKGERIDLSYEWNHESCRIFIKDRGIGLSQEQQQRLFQPFERLGAEMSDVEGTGIGLVICKRLVEAMNGKIGVESLQGEGCTFWIELPLSHEQVSQITQTSNANHNNVINSCRNILYIEDNPINMNVMEVFFSLHENINLLQATHPQQGLEIARTYQPDVILLDIQLADMDGFEVFQQLKKHSLTQHIPVIGISAYAMPQDINKAMQLGFYDYITKPFNFQTLLFSINNAFVDK